MNETITAGNVETTRLPPVYCAIPRLTPNEADTVIAALEAVLYALVDARFPDPYNDSGPPTPDTPVDEIPF